MPVLYSVHIEKECILSARNGVNSNFKLSGEGKPGVRNINTLEVDRARWDAADFEKIFYQARLVISTSHL